MRLTLLSLFFILSLENIHAWKTCKKPPPEPPACSSLTQPYRLEIRYQSPQGIGYDTGYATLEGFFSQPVKDSLLFIDCRGHIFNNGNWAANGGIGFRIPLSSPTIIGGNVYYDYRDGLHGQYQQVAFGLEILKEKWDLRWNTYFPLGHTSHKFRDGFWKFKHHRAYFTKKYQLAMAGTDLEIGRELYQRGRFQLHGTLAGYYFQGRFGENTVGALFNMRAKLTDYFHVDGQVSYDSLFKWLGQGVIGVRIPFGKAKKRTSQCEIGSRLYEPVSRFEIIVETKHRKKAVARDPITHEPLFFVFVDNERGSSNGTYEHPYPTLSQGENFSSSGQVIYVFAGDGTTKGMDTGITLKDRQLLLGSGVSHLFSTKFGPRTLPAQSQNIPNISNINPGVNTVSLANHNTISGFNILASPQGNGVRANGITDAIIDRNIVHGSGTTISFGNANFDDNADIGLINVNGSLSVTHNQTSSTIGIFFSENSGQASHTYNATIANNVHVPQQSLFGIRIWGFNQTEAQFTISSNQIAIDNTPAGYMIGWGHGIAINAADQSQLNALVQNNTINNVDLGRTGLLLKVADESAANTGPSSLNISVQGNMISNFNVVGLGAEVYSVNMPATLHTLTLEAKKNTLLNNVSDPAFNGFGGFFVTVGNNGLARVRLVDNYSTADVANNAYGYLLYAQPMGTVSLLVDSPLGGQLLPVSQVVQALEQINPGTNNGMGIIQFNNNAAPINTFFLPLSDFALNPYDP